MLMQKHSPNTNSKLNENEDVNSNSSHSNGNFFAGRNASLAGSECNDDKSNDACSSGDESHEQDNAEQENQTSFIDSSNRDQFKLSAKKKKKKTVKVKFSGSQDDKAGIKLKIRRTNNFNQDENHVIVDPAEQQRKRHLKTKRNKNEILENNVYKSKAQLEEVSNTVTSDDSLPQKRSRGDSEEEMISKMSVGMNTLSKGTEIDESILGPCQAGSKLTLESVVLMETQSGILIVSVQWRGKTLMGALMESERFQIGTLEKDSIYRREKFMGMNRRNTRRKSKNLFGKKKRKTATPLDPNDVGGTENEAGNSDLDNPYMCDKESCQMKFSDFQALRIHIYQSHRAKERVVAREESCMKIEAALVIKAEPNTVSGVYSDTLLPLLKNLRSECKTGEALAPLTGRNRPSPLPEAVGPQQPEERNSFSPAYSDISDANEAPVLENEAELKPPSSASQPPLNLSLCPHPSLHAGNRLFSPTAPALQPEGLCSGTALSSLRLSHDTKLTSLTNYRYPLGTGGGAGGGKFDVEPSLFANGYLQNLSGSYKPSQNGVLSLQPAAGPPNPGPPSDSSCHNSGIQDLSMSNPLNLLPGKNHAHGHGHSQSNSHGNGAGHGHNHSHGSHTSNHSNSHSSTHSNSHGTSHSHLGGGHAPPPPPATKFTGGRLHPSQSGQSNHKAMSSIGKPNSLYSHQSSRHHQSQQHAPSHHHHSISNGFPPSLSNSKHAVAAGLASVLSSNQSESSAISSSQQAPPNGLPLSHLPYMSFSTSVNSSSPKFSEKPPNCRHNPLNRAARSDFPPIYHQHN